MIEVIWRGDDGYALALSQQGQQRRVSTGLPVSKRGSVNGSTSVPVTPVHERNGTPVPSVGTEDVSQSSSTAVTANVEPEVPSLPKKKSGWSLGFKNLGGGNKGLGLAATKPESASAPPPPPAAVENAGLEKSVEFAPVDVTPVDITPLAITSAAPPVSVEDVNPERPPSPANPGESTPRVAHNEDAEEDKEEKEADRRPASYAESQTSGENTNAFNTPESTSAPLSPEQNVTETVAAPAADHVSTDVTEGNPPSVEVPNVDISSSLPQSEDTVPAPAEEVRSSAPPTPTRPGRRAVPAPPVPGQEQASPSVAPPAVPQRSRARPVSLTLNERNTHASVSSPGKVENVTEEDPSPNAASGEKMDVTDVTMIDSAGGFITPDPSAGSLTTLVTPTPTRSTNAHAPALPPRTSMEKRGSLQSPGIKIKEDESTGSTITAGAQEEADSWESKTWREVVRLKEEIFKARVGVSEES